MIVRLRGELLEVDAGRVVVDCAGVGYEAQVPASVALALPPPGARVDLHVRHVVREDGVALYGFLDSGSRRLFDLLTEVKGCGPKTALALLGELGEDSVVGAIAAQDARALARATGVGPRLGERIVLELKDKVAEDRVTRMVSTRAAARVPDDDLVEALLALGYRRSEAEAAAETARTEASDVSEQLKAALRQLRKA